jgi:hypothetical protein
VCALGVVSARRLDTYVFVFFVTYSFIRLFLHRPLGGLFLLSSFAQGCVCGVRPPTVVCTTTLEPRCSLHVLTTTGLQLWAPTGAAAQLLWVCCCWVYTGFCSSLCVWQSAVASAQQTLRQQRNHCLCLSNLLAHSNIYVWCVHACYKSASAAWHKSKKARDQHRQLLVCACYSSSFATYLQCQSTDHLHMDSALCGGSPATAGVWAIPACTRLRGRSSHVTWLLLPLLLPLLLLLLLLLFV